MVRPSGYSSGPGIKQLLVGIMAQTDPLSPPSLKVVDWVSSPSDATNAETQCATGVGAGIAQWLERWTRD